MHTKGIILAGGSGTRLYPSTESITKQLLPVFDKPMIYYPLSTLMLAEIKDILIISTPKDTPLIKNLLGDGSQWGIKLSYDVQQNPEGIAQAFIIAESFIEGNHSVLILGDNIFYGNNLKKKLIEAKKSDNCIFGYSVSDPARYGIIEFKNNEIVKIHEKPQKFVSNTAVTGIYFYDSNVTQYAKTLKPSKRGELEISDLNNIYIEQNKLKFSYLGRGYSWLDVGTNESLLAASNFISIIEQRQGLKISCPEEISWNNEWISDNDLNALTEKIGKNQYSEYLKNILKNNEV